MKINKVILVLAMVVATATAAMAQQDESNLEVNTYSVELKNALNRTEAEWNKSIELAHEQYKRVTKEKNFKYVNDAKAQNRVRTILNKLITVSHKPNINITIKIYDSYEINAYAIAAEYVFVSTTLLKQMSDGAVAFILAHELGHVMNQTSERKLAHYDKCGYCDKSKQLKYSRQMEHEADALGYYYFNKAGYKYQDAKRALEILESEETHSKNYYEKEIKNAKSTYDCSIGKDAKKKAETKMKDLQKLLDSLVDLNKRTHPKMDKRYKTILNVNSYLLGNKALSTFQPGTAYILNRILIESVPKSLKVLDVPKRDSSTQKRRGQSR